MKPLYLINKKNNWHCQRQKTSRILVASYFVTWTTWYILASVIQIISLFAICCWCLLHFIISQLTLAFIRMPTCQAYKCTNTTGRTTKGKSFFKIPEAKNATEWRRVQQWLHNMGIGQDIRVYGGHNLSILICNQEKKS